jgi:addiction module HigA family antidote
MIVSFASAETEKIWNGLRSRKLPSDIQAVALRKLRPLNQARSGRSAHSAWKPAGGLEGRSPWPAFDPYQRPVACMFHLAGKAGQAMSKSSITTTENEFLPNPHPGEILLEEFLKPLELSQNALARALQVPPRRINEIVLGKRGVTADTDLRLARYFGLSEGFFLGLQADHDLMERRREIHGDLSQITPRAA